MNKSIIISYKENSEDRKFNLKILLNWLINLQDGETEIILVEQDESPKVNWLNDIKGNEFIKYIFVKNDGIFNLGWGYNIGALKSTSDILIFHSVDILIRPISIKNSINNLVTYDIVKPYKTIISLNKLDTIKFTDNNCILPPNNLHIPIIETTLSSGVFIIKKNIFKMLKGFDEDCYGYGYEDNIFDEKIKKLDLKSTYINDSSIHLFHENHENNNDLYYCFTESNKSLFNEYLLMDKNDIINKINDIKEWGDLNEIKSDEISIRHLKKELYEKVSEEILITLSNKFTDDYIKDLMDIISKSIYNTIIEEIKNKITNDLKDIKFNDSKKKSLIKTLIKKFKL